MNEDRIPAAISQKELERRWSFLRTLMENRGLDAVVIQNSNDWLGGYVRWLTGLPAHNAYPRTVLFYADGPMTVIEQGAFGAHYSPPSDDFEFRGIGTVHGSPSYVSASTTADYDAQIAATELNGRACTAIGLVGPASMYHCFAATLLERVGPHRFIDITDDVDAFKAVKSPEEQELIRRAAIMQDEVFAEVAAFIRPGLFDYEISAYAQYRAQCRGSEQGIILGSSSPPGKASVFRGKSAHGRQIANGETFTMLLEVNGPGGYYVESTRTFVLGKASPRLKEELAQVRDAQQYTLSLLLPGADCREIFELYNQYVQTIGLRPERRLHCHGQGYDMVERPLVRHDETMKISAGMNIVVHPGKLTEENFSVVCGNYIIGQSGPGSCLHDTSSPVVELST